MAEDSIPQERSIVQSALSGPVRIVPEQPRAISVPAYLAAVAVGCCTVGASLYGIDYVQGRGGPDGPLIGLVLYTVFGLLIGYIPGLLLWLPPALLCRKLAARFALRSVVSYSILGGASGISVPILVQLAFRWLGETIVLVDLAFLIAGASAGVIYFYVEAADTNARLKREIASAAGNGADRQGR